MRECVISGCTYRPTNWESLEKSLKQIYGDDNISYYLGIYGIKSGGCGMYRLFNIKDNIVAFVILENYYKKKCDYAKKHIHNLVDYVFALENVGDNPYVINLKDNTEGNIQNYII